jgi:hypothetical protein
MRPVCFAQFGKALHTEDGDERVTGQNAHEHKDNDGDAKDGEHAKAEAP